MDESILTAEKEVLVAVVKMAQKQKLKGDKGDWKEFLAIHDKNVAQRFNDPAKRSTDDLLSFLKTFSDEEVLKSFTKTVQTLIDRKSLAHPSNGSTEIESPQQKLVTLTLQHPDYLSNYLFPTQNEKAMEAQLPVQLWIYTILGCIILFPFKSVQCSIVLTPCSRKYLSESYFEKHDSLLDSNFQDFLTHELSSCYCNAFPSVLILQRNLIGEGSHRYLSTIIKLGTFERPAKKCKAVVLEKLPSGVFADPFELQHLVHRGAFLDADVSGDTNLELPSALSNRSVVEIHIDIGQNILSGSKRSLEFNLDLPLHARYPPLSENGYSQVEFGMPDIFMQCITEEEPQKNSSCWITMNGTSDTKSSVVWKIPCGNKAHSQIVSLVTFLLASVSTLLIVLSAIYSPNVSFVKNSKQL